MSVLVLLLVLGLFIGVFRVHSELRSGFGFLQAHGDGDIRYGGVNSLMSNGQSAFGFHVGYLIEPFI